MPCRTERRAMRIVMIEDDESITEIVSLAFEMRWPETELISTDMGEKGIELVKSEKPDLVILDLGLPDISGFDVLQRIRSFSTVPIIILTVRAEEADVIQGVELGADDYVVKPFRQLELLGRAQALVRRSAKTERQAPLECGSMYLDPSTRCFVFKGNKMTLTATETDILYCLMREQGSVVPNSRLVEAIWGRDYRNSGETLKIHIRRLRERIEPDPDHPRLILTKPGNGHSLAR
ncbi:MAG: DNA-binding response regulator [Chloroflexi bacterium]|nr:MAG: DNA-binding response regulator [Chloroflexota bacterium]